ncbi:hypothetical protein TNCV_3592181 [Trichonephila clavipes]|nr:hypothetical protein TNCV_3592181 [Trichonephila clavipes]
MDGDHHAKKSLQCPTNCTWRKVKPKFRWIDGPEKDLLDLRTKNWRTLAGRRLTWKRDLEKAKALPVMSSD